MENCLYTLLVVLLFSVDGAQSYGAAKTHQIGKIWPLTLTISVRHRYPTIFLVEFVFTCWVLTYEFIFPLGSWWRMELWHSEICARALFINSSIQRNMIRQRYPNFVFWNKLCTQLEVSKYVYHWLGRAWRTLLHLLKMYILFWWLFLPQISIFFFGQTKNRKNLGVQI